MRWVLALLHLITAVAMLVFLVLAELIIAASACTLCANQVVRTIIVLVTGGGIGWLAIRMLIGLHANFSRQHRRWLAERALPRARIVLR